MMSSSRPTILLIPGAWHQGESWEPVTSLLRDQGYPVEPVSLPSAGGPPTSTVEDDAEHIRKAHLDELIAQGRDVVIVMHSYSGVPGTECVKGLSKKDLAAQGKHGGVIALVYVTCYLLEGGKSSATTIPSDHPFLIDPTKGDATFPIDPRNNFYNDLDDETASKYIDNLVHHALQSFLTPLTYEAYRDVPASYLFCENDKAIQPSFQKKMVAAAGDGIRRTDTCTAGHFPMLTMPDKVVDFINKSIDDATV